MSCRSIYFSSGSDNYQSIFSLSCFRSVSLVLFILKLYSFPVTVYSYHVTSQRPLQRKFDQNLDSKLEGFIGKNIYKDSVYESVDALGTNLRLKLKNLLKIEFMK